MEAYQERVVAEKYELDERIAKLKTFAIDPGNEVFEKLQHADRALLLDQYKAMVEYSRILGCRIERFLA